MTENVLERPFYREFAWAYDLIIPAPTKNRCDFWEEVSSRRCVLPGSKVLDAGCGTGGYAIELAQRGYVVTGLDASAELVKVARNKAKRLNLTVRFKVGSILALPAKPKYSGVLCRGVLNDLIDDADRQAAFHSFARVLTPGGVLVLDVREWHATAAKKASDAVFEKRVETDRGMLAFRSVTRLDHKTRQLLVAERHILQKEDMTVETEFDFVMRCWTREELHSNLTRAGFDSIAYFGDYDLAKPLGFTERIVAAATRL